MLTTLPNLYRRVLWLRFGHALPREAVAAPLDRSVAVTKAWQHRSMHVLRER